MPRQASGHRPSENDEHYNGQASATGSGDRNGNDPTWLSGNTPSTPASDNHMQQSPGIIDTGIVLDGPQGIMADMDLNMNMFDLNAIQQQGNNALRV
jgi:hypothetical protein